MLNNDIELPIVMRLSTNSLTNILEQ